MREQAFEVKSAALLTIDALNEFIFENLRKPSKKSTKMAENVQKFYNQYRGIFSQFLRTIAYTLLFEDHKNVWIFQKAVHSTIVMCEGGSQEGVQTSFKIIQAVILENEADLLRREKLQKEVELFLGAGGSASNGFPFQSLDIKSRDRFQAYFNQLKCFLYDFGPDN